MALENGLYLGWLPAGFSHPPVALFIASATLPDEVPAEGLDLDAYYFANRTYFWTLFLLLAVSTTASTVSHRATSATTVAEATRWILASGNLTLVVLSSVLILTARRWVHAGLVLFMLAALVWQWVALTIAG